jgi:hypothetical protein
MPSKIGFLIKHFPRCKRFKHSRHFRDFISNIKIGDLDECWEWSSSTDKHGRGFWMWKEKKLWRAHQAAYYFFVGRIPKKHGKRLCICHSCDNPPCCNPNCLWPGTSKQNSVDMVSKDRQARGEKNGTAKLTYELAVEIRKQYARKKGRRGMLIGLARRHGVTDMTIWHIVNGNTWKEAA